jgi:sucrose-6-phosphate hydrolase SacC (GH32 family)
MAGFTNTSAYRQNRQLVVLLFGCVLLAALVLALAPAATKLPTREDAFPLELVSFTADARNPIFTAAKPGEWDAKIRERGWIMRDGAGWKLWYTGYDGTADGIRLLGLATSPDGIHWTRYPGNPLIKDLWVEDMIVIRQGGTYYMFAEGAGDLAQLLTSADGIHWEPQGKLDVRYTNGKPLTPGPFGTPAVWHENGVWYLFYERMDQAIWLASSRDLKVWTNVQDAPVLNRGPEEHDEHMIALNQVFRYRGAYYAVYHGTGGETARRVWNTNLARSTDLIHWEKYPGNPIVRDRSSGQFHFDGRRLRLYTTHDRVDLYWPVDPEQDDETGNEAKSP